MSFVLCSTLPKTCYSPCGRFMFLCVCLEHLFLTGNVSAIYICGVSMSWMHVQHTFTWNLSNKQMFGFPFLCGSRHSMSCSQVVFGFKRTFCHMGRHHLDASSRGRVAAATSVHLGASRPQILPSLHWSFWPLCTLLSGVCIGWCSCFAWLLFGQIGV